MLDSVGAPCTPFVVAKRFLRFTPDAQQAILQQLRATFFPEGFFYQVPAAEWLRLLSLTDPLIYSTDNKRQLTYHVLEGRELLLLLVGHYLDV
ncbi:hypothetical protein MTX78_23275 (plasmid) [Hymenobacter tibetensis]|uniref:mRNA interferase YoeB n=1 Tax=Hymenobacter tibetensis TaxID=497967 RepID=A0ABY4D5M3_9BACT|nr:hypothetical protein [Hymenobacter tibetensis]UOG77352.1 hypothetical protein MTX78_23275 [Hymenobacter tibetensis]